VAAVRVRMPFPIVARRGDVVPFDGSLELGLGSSRLAALLRADRRAPGRPVPASIGFFQFEPFTRPLARPVGAERASR